MKFTFKIMFLFIVCFVISSCSKEENNVDDFNLALEQKEVLFDFLTSNDFKNLPYSVSDINKELTTVQNVDIEGNLVPVIYVYFGLDKNNLKGLLKAIKLTNKDSKRKVLPNNNDFAMLYFNFDSYDFLTKSGKVDISDVNYDNFVFLTSTFSNAKLVDEVFNRVDRNIFVKYGYFKPGITEKSIPDSCHGGDNGDVSWSECMHCFKSICKSSIDCHITLQVADLIGIQTGWGPIGSASFAVACVYISAIN